MHGGLVNWREWGDEAFAEAGRDEKLILLDISAVWCHWCHVMDDTSYSDPSLAALVNTRFVPVRVDTDRMPDINERYNMGGWPTTAVLTPTGEVLVGATYVAPGKLKETLAEIDAFYRLNKDALKEKVRELKEKREEEQKAWAAAPPGEVSLNISAYVLEELDRNYDPVHGGFGSDPKFPAPEAQDLLLAAYQETGRRNYLEMAAKTLAGMSSYGMYDHVAGGFFRYSTTRDWTVPHYEKMLDVNSGLVTSYINAYRATGDRGYMDTAVRTLGYMEAWLWSEEGYFFGSQDADEEYYRLPPGDRDKRTAPHVDRTMYTSQNARAAVACMTAWEALGEGRYMDKALSILRFILNNMKGEGGGLYHYHDGGPKRFGLLTDNSPVLRALIHAYQHTGEAQWLGEALSLLGYIEKTYWDQAQGAFFDLPDDPGALAALSTRTKQLAENSEMSVSLKTLYVITGDERYLVMAGRCLEPHARSYREFSYMAAGYALAVEFYLKPVTELTIVGDAGGADTAALAGAARGLFIPRRVMRILDFEKNKEEIRKRGYHGSGRAAAYICREFACAAKVEDPGMLKENLFKEAA